MLVRGASNYQNQSYRNAMKKIALYLIVGLALAYPLLAQSGPKFTLTGQVISAKDASVLPGASVIIKGTKERTVTDIDGNFSLTVSKGDVLVVLYVGFKDKEYKVKKNDKQIIIALEEDAAALEEVVVMGIAAAKKAKRNRRPGMAQAESMADYSSMPQGYAPGIMVQGAPEPGMQPNYNREGYDPINETGFKSVANAPLSTFAIDVDEAAYANVRRFLNYGQLPPPDAVRIEELLNYFTYNYEAPKTNVPFAVNTELSACPWNEQHQLLHVGLQAKKIKTQDLPPSNLVFLLDVSGSMDAPNKLPLLKQSLGLLISQLRKQDRVAIVVYAGAAGLVLPSTSGANKAAIVQALDKLQAGGSTAGGAGIELAYKVAQEHFMANGNNRVILATDGDFNVGASSNADMQRLIEKQRASGVFLSVLGFGTGNYQDSKAEILANKGNGNYAYIDNLRQGRKVLIEQFGGTLFTVAKDVKFQLEFNPARVKGYRLIGYENRRLNDEDFNNDKKDAGELGAGHSVTALYEIIPAGSSEVLNEVDSLKYQRNQSVVTPDLKAEMLTVKLRYKKPNEEVSTKVSIGVQGKMVSLTNSSNNFRFAAAVAQFGLLLGQSEYKGQSSYQSVLALARKARGDDPHGYRSEFVGLVELARDLAAAQESNKETASRE